MTISNITARLFVASVWYDIQGMTKKEKLYAKAKELIAGDRAEIAYVTKDARYLELTLEREAKSKSTQ